MSETQARVEATEIERKRWIKMLTEMEVIRDSMLGQEWQVIYTMNGAEDIEWTTLIGDTE